MPAAALRTCNDWLHARPKGIWVAQTTDGLSRFRMAPLEYLKLLETTLRFASKTLPPPGQVIWALENHENRGLDDFEAEAVFGQFLDIDLLEQVNRGLAVSQILVAGRLREEV